SIVRLRPEWVRRARCIAIWALSISRSCSGVVVVVSIYFMARKKKDSQCLALLPTKKLMPGRFSHFLRSSVWLGSSKCFSPLRHLFLEIIWDRRRGVLLRAPLARLARRHPDRCCFQPRGLPHPQPQRLRPHPRRHQSPPRHLRHAHRAVGLLVGGGKIFPTA